MTSNDIIKNAMVAALDSLNRLVPQTLHIHKPGTVCSCPKCQLERSLALMDSMADPSLTETPLDDSTTKVVKAIWTKPYYRLSHIHNCPISHQISMTTFDSDHAHVYLLHLHGQRPFTAVKSFSGSIKEARAKGQTWLNQLLND